MIFQGERENVQRALTIAEVYGYGNLIAHLKRAWAIKLMKSNPLLTYEDAVEATNVSAYPLRPYYLDPPSSGSEVKNGNV